MSVTLVDHNVTMARFRLQGNPANAIVPFFFSQLYLPEGLTPSISWGVEGAGFLKEGHDPFPAYELEIHKKVIHTWDPIPKGNSPAGLAAAPGFRVKLDDRGPL
jgi:hypothetical protein